VKQKEYIPLTARRAEWWIRCLSWLIDYVL